MLSITFATIDRSSLCGFKGNFTFLFTIRASRFVHCPRTVTTSFETHMLFHLDFNTTQKENFRKEILKNNLLYDKLKRCIAELYKD
jgi:hypothetical protein